MRRHSAAGKGDARKPLAVFRHVRGAEILRHEDERGAVGFHRVLRGAGGDTRGTPAQRANVVGPRRQQGVRQRGDHGGVLLGRVDHGRSRAQAALRHGLGHR